MVGHVPSGYGRLCQDRSGYDRLGQVTLGHVRSC
jgi:hypothetical protein